MTGNERDRKARQMLIEDHRSKAERFDVAAAELVDSDREALHQVGVTVARDECATNAMGQYVSHTGAELPAKANVGDLIHSDMPRIMYPSDTEWSRVEAALAQIERLAATCLRGPHRDSAWGLAEAHAAAQQFNGHLHRAIASTRGAAPDPAASRAGTP
jgi:hypothetical protein